MGAEGKPGVGGDGAKGNGGKAAIGNGFQMALQRELEAVSFRRGYIQGQRPLASEKGEATVHRPLAWANQPTLQDGQTGPGSPVAPQRDTVASAAAQSVPHPSYPRSSSDLPLHTTPLPVLPGFDAGSFDLTDRFARPPDTERGRLSEAGEAPWRQGDPLTGADRLNLTGIGLSGGGIRSAAFCMGALQGIDALSGRGRSPVIDRIDYLSTVSGGNYMGTSVATGMMHRDGSFPYESKTDQAETLESQHLRNYSSFLIPKGFIDYLSWAYVLLRGLVTNAAMALPALLLLSLVVISMNPEATDLAKADFFGFWQSSFNGIWPTGLGTMVAAPVLLGALVLFMLVWTSARRWIDFPNTCPLETREKGGRILGWSLLGLGLVVFVEWQPAILREMFDALAKAAENKNPDPSSGLSQTVARFFASLGQAGYVIAPVAAALVAASQKLFNMLQATLGDTSWVGTIKRILSKFSLYALGLVVPLLLWILFLNLAFWGIQAKCKAYAHAPAFLTTVASWISACRWDFVKNPFWLEPAIGMIGVAYFWAAVLLAAFAACFSANANSLNALYRDRLARAFLTQHDKLEQGLPSEAVDTWRFSSLKPGVGHERALTEPGAAGFSAKAAFSPYLLVNTAINIQGSKLLNQRGRNADVFTLGPLVCGSDATGYVPTSALERVDPNMTLATGMAISGAAASANMGGNTIGALTFSLAMLNVRLGYWLQNPKSLKPERKRSKTETGIGAWWFLRELLGNIKDDSARVYLTDGGHIDNLGLYELLKRRCRVIIVVDAEADQGMVFSSFVRVQMLARIDHGVTIQSPWPNISVASLAAGKATGTADEQKLYNCTGPHVSVGRIVYRRGTEDDAGSMNVHGVLIYLKSSLSGDENDIVRDYRRRHPEFPHETTIDQFFSEEQFEVYRALGFHIAHGFFTGKSDASFWTPPDRARTLAFLEEVRAGLDSIGVPANYLDAIMDRALKATDAELTARGV
jgi:hypothetical protein